MKHSDNHFVASSFPKDEDYLQWLRQIKEQYRRSQARAAVRVNDAMIAFYWYLGHEIVDLKAESRWGDGVIEQLSLDMREAFPGAKGFSTRNLWYVKSWYMFYHEHIEKLKQAVAVLEESGEGNPSRGTTDCNTILQQAVAGLEYPSILGFLPWSQHIAIVSKCKDIDEAIFYIRKSIESRWGREALKSFIDSDLFHTQGSLASNFDKTLPDEYRMKVNDMLFYHVRLKCFVVVELKVTDFKSEYAGKLNFYVTAVDKLLKQDDDKPTIGLLICRSKDNTKVEWSFDGLNKPIGVAAYELRQFLPSAEEMERQIKLMEGE